MCGRRARQRLTLPLPGRHNVANALAALAAASVWGIGATEAAQVFPHLLPGEMRGRLLRFAEGFAVINDSYNSNPVALRAMTDLLAHTPGFRQRGSLPRARCSNSGRSRRACIARLGAQAAALKLDRVIGVQGDAAEIRQRRGRRRACRTIARAFFRQLRRSRASSLPILSSRAICCW